MPLGKKMPNGTRVKHLKKGVVGATQQWLPNAMPAGGYRVKWDHDSSEEDVRIHELDPEGGSISAADYDDAVKRVTQNLGGYNARHEGTWGHGESILIVSKPGYLPASQEMHAHAGVGGGIRKAHVKQGESYVRDVYKDGAFTGSATTDDKNWVAQIKLRNSLIHSKQDYMDGKKKLPQ